MNFCCSLILFRSEVFFAIRGENSACASCSKALRASLSFEVRALPIFEVRAPPIFEAAGQESFDSAYTEAGLL